MKTAFILNLLSLWAAFVSAFAQSRSASLTGYVYDPSGATVASASVQLVREGRVVASTRSNGSGRYQFSELEPATYSLRSIAKGFALAEQTGLALVATQAGFVDVHLTIQMETQVVSVADQAHVEVDPARNTGALVLSGKDLESLSDDPDDLSTDLQALAGPSAGPNGGQIFIDGFAGGRLPPKQSIREIRINSNPFAAEYDKLGFGRIEIFTKPGTDNFHGQGFFTIGDESLNARNPYSVTKAPYQLKQYGGNVSGPFGRRASFFLDVDRRDIDENALVVADTLDSSYNVQRINSSVVTPNRRTSVSPRVDLALNDRNTLTVRYTFTQQDFENQGVGQTSLVSQALQQSNRENTAQISETAILSAHAINEVRFQYIGTRNSQSGNSNSPAITVVNSFTDGGASLSSNYTSQDRFELQNYLSVTLAKHQVKFGVRARGVREDVRSTSNYNGTFTFSGTGSVSSLEIYRKSELLHLQGRTYAEIAALGYGPSFFTLTTGNPLAGVGQFDLGFFAQDDWRLRPNLTLSGGLRLEAQNNLSNAVSLAPRLGVAWAPGRNANGVSSTVLRAGFGIFYDRLSEDLTLNVDRYNGVNAQQFVIRNPTFYPNLPSSDVLAGYQSQLATYHEYHGIRAPYTLQTTWGIERQLPKNIKVAANYVYSRGVHQLLTRNINAPINGVRPLGVAAADVYLYESSGFFRQNQLITTVQARVSPKLTAFGFYMLGSAKSNTDGVNTFPANSYDLNADYSRAGFDSHQRAFIGGSLTLPWKITLSPFFILNSGAPYNLITGHDNNGDGIINDRPAFATGLTRPSVVKTKFGYFDTDPFAGETIVPRNYLQGPGQISANMRISRTWSFGERSGSSPNMMMVPGGPGGPPPGGPGGGPPPGMFGGGSGKYNLTLTVQSRNFLNHVNPGTPSGDLSSPFFGQSTSLGGGFGPGGPGGGGPPGFVSGAAANRRVEFQLRFSF